MIPNLVVCIALFCSLYFEVFLLITYFEKRKTLKKESESKTIENWPTVNIVVPCFNEGKTVIATIESILNLNYPKDKLQIIAVDDGSTDNTLNILQKSFGDNPQVLIHHKENGGKFTALNFGIEKSNSDLFGCLDADSFVDKDALKNMIPYFEDKKTMAVVPAVRAYEQDNNWLQSMQQTEYHWGVFVRKTLSYLNALHVTPGPFSIFRKKVFAQVGNYKHAHQTEDLEMALRMQKHNLKIVCSHKSFVYTVTPETIKKLYKQRRRWTFGFLKNAIDYKCLFFRKEYGNIAFFILPLAVVSIFTAIFIAINFLVSNINTIAEQIHKIQITGIEFSKPHFDWFYLNTGLMSVMGIISGIMSIGILLIAIKLSTGKIKIRKEFFYFIFLYPILAPFWLASAVFNTIFSKTISWR